MGKKKEKETDLEEALMLKDRFRVYSNLSEDKVLSEKVREAVMYQEKIMNREIEFGLDKDYEGWAMVSHGQSMVRTLQPTR